LMSVQSGARTCRAVGIQAGPEEEVRRRAVRREDAGREVRQPTREDAMNWNHSIRQFHRWLSIAFTVTVIANIVALVAQRQVVWLGLLALPPLVLLMLSGLYLFVLPYLAKWRSGRRAD
jgi:hypothetical protein